MGSRHFTTFQSSLRSPLPFPITSTKHHTVSAWVNDGVVAHRRLQSEAAGAVGLARGSVAFGETANEEVLQEEGRRRINMPS